MNVKRIVRYLKGVPSAKSLIDIVTPPKFVNVYTESDWAGQATTCKSTSGGIVQWRNATLTAWSRTQQTVSVTLMNHVDSQSAKAWASKRGLGRMKHVMLKYMFVQDVVEKKLTNLEHTSTRKRTKQVL